jgi:hypothetical protein
MLNARRVVPPLAVVVSANAVKDSAGPRLCLVDGQANLTTLATLELEMKKAYWNVTSVIAIRRK